MRQHPLYIPGQISFYTEGPSEQGDKLSFSSSDNSGLKTEDVYWQEEVKCS